MPHFMTPTHGAPDVRVAASRSGAMAAAPYALRIGLVLTVLTLLVAIESAAQEHSNPWLLTWIPPLCCVTDDCCWEVTERELRPLPGDKWQVVATGQIRDRTAWSPDGKFYRCACDLDNGKWVRHEGANTRCVFVPMRSAAVMKG